MYELYNYISYDLTVLHTSRYWLSTSNQSIQGYCNVDVAILWSLIFHYSVDTVYECAQAVFSTPLDIHWLTWLTCSWLRRSCLSMGSGGQTPPHTCCTVCSVWLSQGEPSYTCDKCCTLDCSYQCSHPTQLGYQSVVGREGEREGGKEEGREGGREGINGLKIEMAKENHKMYEVKRLGTSLNWVQSTIQCTPTLLCTLLYSESLLLYNAVILHS